ncbi:GAF and ANTAR domain-containing protein [Actinokineospora inagensis]|uniref:GAF and ANTAR domain-containing protein n=1 Tax=Actinokineospora inagensis TaxID=103730 RepID=UPI000421517B|nr:GAF and ANTAR domain-containing protein [Actinokineospora inagensis]
MRQQRLVETFVELADTLVAEFDVVEFLHMLVERSIELLSVDAASILLATADGDLHMIASSNDDVGRLERFQATSGEGPCVTAYRTGEPVARPDLTLADSAEARFAAAALNSGYRAVFAFPMRLRNETIGSLNLFRSSAGTLDDLSARTAKALVSVATIGLLQARSIRNQEVVAEQLQYALTSRITIEQAKGVLAERYGVDIASAFTMLRRHARARGTRLSDLARTVVTDPTWTPGPMG